MNRCSHLKLVVEQSYYLCLVGTKAINDDRVGNWMLYHYDRDVCKPVHTISISECRELDQCIVLKYEGIAKSFLSLSELLLSSGFEHRNLYSRNIQQLKHGLIPHLDELSSLYYLLGKKTFRDFTILNLKIGKWFFSSLIENMLLLQRVRSGITTESLNNSLFDEENLKEEKPVNVNTSKRPVFYLNDLISGVSIRLQISTKVIKYAPRENAFIQKSNDEIEVHYSDAQSVRVGLKSPVQLASSLTMRSVELDDLNDDVLNKTSTENVPDENPISQDVTREITLELLTINQQFSIREYGKVGDWKKLNITLHSSRQYRLHKKSYGKIIDVELCKYIRDRYLKGLPQSAEQISEVDFSGFCLSCVSDLEQVTTTILSSKSMIAISGAVCNDISTFVEIVKEEYQLEGK